MNRKWTNEEKQEIEELIKCLENNPLTLEEKENWQKKYDNMSLKDVADGLLNDMKKSGDIIAEEEWKNVDDKITEKITKEEEKKILEGLLLFDKIFEENKGEGKDLTENL